MANNSSGARSVLYGKTIDHVLEQEVVLVRWLGRAVPRRCHTTEVEEKCAGEGLEAECYRVVRRLAREHAGEIDRRFPKVLRRVGGYNLDEFVGPDRPFNLSKLMVGSEGTLGVVLEAKINLVPLPAAKAVLAIQFAELLEALEATPLILRHRPSAIEVMDRFILDHTRQSAQLDALAQAASSKASPAHCCAWRCMAIGRRTCRRGCRPSSGSCASAVSAIATTTRSICRDRRESGACAKPPWAFRWR